MKEREEWLFGIQLNWRLNRNDFFCVSSLHEQKKSQPFLLSFYLSSWLFYSFAFCVHLGIGFVRCFQPEANEAERTKKLVSFRQWQLLSLVVQQSVFLLPKTKWNETKAKGQTKKTVSVCCCCRCQTVIIRCRCCSSSTNAIIEMKRFIDNDKAVLITRVDVNHRRKLQIASEQMKEENEEKNATAKWKFSPRRRSCLVGRTRNTSVVLLRRYENQIFLVIII